MCDLFNYDMNGTVIVIHCLLQFCSLPFSLDQMSFCPSFSGPFCPDAGGSIGDHSEDPNSENPGGLAADGVTDADED